ncbi:MAG: phosphate butyryltransferase [bacterium]|nr:phosphate butyryltransferase [bacterium]
MEQIRSLDQLLEEMKQATSRRLAIAAGHDPHTIQAAAMAADMDIAKVTLVGKKSRILELCGEYSINESLFNIIDEPIDKNAGIIARDMVTSGKADVLMKGLLSTDAYMRLILDKEKGLLPKNAVLSHVTCLEVPEYHKIHNKLLFITDVAIIPAPDLATKVKMVNYAVASARSFGVEVPKVAMLAPTEVVSIKIQSCTDAAIISKMAERGQFGNCIVEGPLALDVAISPQCCADKGLKTSINGAADILVFHCLEASNSFYKACTLLGRARLAGSVVGTTAPCVLTSRADSEESKLCSIALGCRLVK